MHPDDGPCTIGTAGNTLQTSPMRPGGRRLRRERLPVAVLVAAGVCLLMLAVLVRAPSPSLAAQLLVAPGRQDTSSPYQAVTATVRFEQAVYFVEPDEILTVDLLVEDVQDLAAWEVLLDFDRLSVAVIEVAAGSFLSSTLRTTQLPDQDDQIIQGLLVIAGYSYDTPRPASPGRAPLLTSPCGRCKLAIRR